MFSLHGELVVSIVTELYFPREAFFVHPSDPNHFPSRPSLLQVVAAATAFVREAALAGHSNDSIHKDTLVEENYKIPCERERERQRGTLETRRIQRPEVSSIQQQFSPVNASNGPDFDNTLSPVLLLSSWWWPLPQRLVLNTLLSPFFQCLD
jgi:hypothetical protein